MSLHPKIESYIQDEKALMLSNKSLTAIAAIEQFTDQIHKQAQKLFENRDLLFKYQQLSDFSGDPKFYIDNKILFPQMNDSIEQYREKIIQELRNLSKMARELSTVSDQAEPTKINAKTLQFLKDAEERISKASAEDQYEFHDICVEVLEKCWEELDDPVDAQLQNYTSEQIQSLSEAINDEEKRLNREIETYKTVHHVDFDLDSQYQLIKISKRSKIDRSVVYVKAPGEEKAQAFILYPGKEGMVLGQGSFGKVKFCQNIHTGEWKAVKIQLKAGQTEQAVQSENAVLTHLNRFIGQAAREEKYYSVQDLLPGVDLKDYIDQHRNDDVQTRLLIAQKAVDALQSFHQSYLHCDIKPGNFLWDEKTQTLSLIDFGMAKKLEDNQQEVAAEAGGTREYLAPELNDTAHNVTYTKKSDIYSLGKVFEELFEGIDDVPEEVRHLIDKMTQENPTERIAATSEIIETLEKAAEAIYQTHKQPKLN